MQLLDSDSYQINSGVLRPGQTHRGDSRAFFRSI